MNLAKPKLRLLMILPSTERGGAEEYALTIVSAAVAEGWDVHIAFPKRGATASLVQSFEDRGVSYYPLEIAEPNFFSKFKTLKAHLPHLLGTVHLLLKNKPDVVQIMVPSGRACFGSILACGLLMIPTAVVFQLMPFPLDFNNQKLKAYAWARARNQQWISVSEHNRKVVSKSFKIPLDDVLCIYNGAKTVVSTASNLKPEEITTARFYLRQELNLPPTSRLALSVARLNLQKGHIDLIPAIPHLIREFPDLRLVWVGDGEEREKLVAKVREYGVEDQVLFLGYRSDVPRLLIAADLFIFPSRFEGQPFALIEAMVHGLPIVTSDTCGIPELIEHGVHGLLFRTGDSCDLLEATRWALRHPEEMQQMAINAKLRAQEFSEERMVKETLSVLQKLSYAHSAS